MARTAKRQLLFKQGAVALGRLAPVYAGLYGCPICKRLFPDDALVSGGLTLEHAPPRAVGGRAITLTCRDCNNSAGKSIDAAVASREKLRTLGRAVFGRVGSYTGPVTLHDGANQLNAILRAVDGRVAIEVPEWINDPAKFRAQAEHFRAAAQVPGQASVPFHIRSGTRFHADRSKVGDLRAAYLTAFAVFGYFYAMHPRLDPVREQIRHPEALTLGSAWWLTQGALSVSRFLHFQSPFPGLLVRPTTVTVLLPWISGPEDFYTEVRRAFGQGSEVQLGGTEYEWPTQMHMLLDRAQPPPPSAPPSSLSPH